MPSVRDEYAKKILDNHHLGMGILLPPPPVVRSSGETITVGIIGAGVAGLFTAMLLEKAIKDHGLDIKYEILEAETVEGGHPFGGRLWTHRFSDSKNDYYDRGAMRFPDIPYMKPVMDLFTELELDGVKIPYIMSTSQNTNFFNGRRLTNMELQIKTRAKEYDPFGTGVQGITGTVDEMIKRQIEPFRRALKDDFGNGWKALTNYDAYSMRAFMRQCGTVPHGKYDEQVIAYLETFDTGTGFYDLALSEIVLDSLDFDYDGDEIWYFIQGGASVIANAMAKKLPEGKIFNDERVTAIAPTTSGLAVTTSGDQPPRTYSHVISTMPLSCLRTVDTSQCEFSWDLQTAIRSLHYSASTKVAIKFKERWWERKGQIGGVSRTDRPTRVVVYPSYGIGSGDTTMIVSYTLAQDASRFGPFSGNRDSEKALLDVILKDLADMHDIKDHNDLHNLVSDHDVWSWDTQESSAGAFAHFGPGQFTQLYLQITKPAANGRLHFAGEAASVHHAWVLGALNSAARVVCELGICEGQEDLIKAVQASWSLTDAEADLWKKQCAIAMAETPTTYL